MLEGLLSRAKTDARREELEAELACPPLPEALAYIWRAFLRLHNRRPSAMGVSPISWPDLHAFTATTGFRLAPWEIEMIEQIDDLWLAERARSARSGS